MNQIPAAWPNGDTLSCDIRSQYRRKLPFGALAGQKVPEVSYLSTMISAKARPEFRRRPGRQGISGLPIFLGHQSNVMPDALARRRQAPPNI